MKTNVITKHIQRSNRNLLAANVCLLLSLMAVILSNQRYLYNLFWGPFPMDSQALLATKNPETNSKYFVTIRGEQSLDTNVQEVSKRVDKYTGETKSESVTANYLALVVNKRLLLVKAGDNKKATEFTGSLVTIPEDARTKIISDIESQNPRLRNVFLPVMLEVSDFRVWGYWLFGLGIPLAALGIWNLNRVAHRRKNPDKHPIMQSLTRFGATEAIAAQIDAEVQMEANNSTVGSIVITPSWLLKSSTFDLNIVNLNELVWVYKKVTTHYKSDFSR